ncbi:hypothetical protein [Vreelandella nanhaiensis]|uniref:Uncharacterized protein n=1 Tax=Vreelandella nanhaiensis TaxID=1258546 RepID=A0A3S0Y070_9GAMM|nr:hypothetical protein [Halomonas nanhaiensis]RUR34492.1 hypothetical protein ELY38_02565 [Halomonas nanhaiensis]
MALSKEGSTMREMYEQMPIGRLREFARESHAGHDPEATRIFVSRVLDMEVERRTWFAHENLGFQPFSSTAKLGEHPGGGTAAADPLAIAYDRGIRVHAAHEEARQFLEYAKLRPRALLAALIQAAKTDRRVTGPWGKSYDQIAADLGPYAQRLGFSPGIGAGATLVCFETEARAILGNRKACHIPRSAEERNLLAGHWEQSVDGYARMVETKHQVPLFNKGQAIKRAALEARAQMIMLAKIG